MMRPPILFFLLLFIPSVFVFGQTDTHDPYSYLGDGEAMQQGSLQNMAMGGTGLSYSDPFLGNGLNPALGFHNRLFLFDLKGFGEWRRFGKGDSHVKETGASSFFTPSLSRSPEWQVSLPLSFRSSFALGSRLAGKRNYYNAFFTQPDDSPIYQYFQIKGKGSAMSHYAVFSTMVYDKANKRILLGVEAKAVASEQSRDTYTLFESVGGSHRMEYFRRDSAYQIAASIKLGVYGERFWKDSYKISAGIVYEQQVYEYSRSESNLRADTEHLSQKDFPNPLGGLGFPESASGTDGFRYDPKTAGIGISIQDIPTKKYNVSVGINYAWAGLQNPLADSVKLKNVLSYHSGGEYSFVLESALVQYIQVRAGLSYTPDAFALRASRSRAGATAFSGGFTLPLGARFRLTAAGVYSIKQNTLPAWPDVNVFRLYAGLTYNGKWFTWQKGSE